jgi:ABC-type multidrug transport system fused ATPase/permease subunit
MDSGEIVEQGTHDQLMRIDGWYSELARMQSVA